MVTTLTTFAEWIILFTCVHQFNSELWAYSYTKIMLNKTKESMHMISKNSSHHVKKCQTVSAYFHYR